jgi:chemotaxis methyl-accepting protein methylase
MSPTTLLAAASAAPSESLGESVLQLVAALAERTGVDLAGQRPAMLARRAAQRIGASGARTLAEYLERLRDDDAEAWRLLEHLTIKVSRLFRNPGTFAFLGEHVLPELRRRAAGRALHAWSAGCACGEEAYGLAMLLAASPGAWSVLGTDLDGSALARARAGTYPAPEELRFAAAIARRHLEPRPDGTVAVRGELARHVRFEAHDLASGAPSPGACFDLVACRNVLIYYLRDRQARFLSTLLSSLRPGGYLVLGEAEWPPPEAERCLEVVDRGHRIFRRAPDAARGSVT